MHSPSILILGYGGANNTGADVRIMAAIEDVRAVFGRYARIGISTISREKTERALRLEGSDVIEVPLIFFASLWRTIGRFDIVLLVEGSTFKENWARGLLYFYLWSAFCARLRGRRCLAYAVEAGSLRWLSRLLVRHVCNRLDLLIVRNEASREQLRSIGVVRPINVTADTAFRTRGRALKFGAGRPVVGLAPVEFHEWPVRMRLWSFTGRCYRWPYYFSWNKQREELSASLVEAWVTLLEHVVREHCAHVKLIAMEELDHRICDRVLSRLPAATRACVTPVYAGARQPDEIVGELQNLDYLVTSRYHACVLSMVNAVPQLALYHDERLPRIYEEMDMTEFALPCDTPDLSVELARRFDDLVAASQRQRQKLSEWFSSYFLPRCYENRKILAAWKESEFPASAAA